MKCSKLALETRTIHSFQPLSSGGPEGVVEAIDSKVNEDLNELEEHGHGDPQIERESATQGREQRSIRYLN